MQESFRSEVSGLMLWFTYQISHHSIMNENILNLKYPDNAILTDMLVKRDRIY